MSISLEEAAKIASLAKLEFSNEELEVYRGHLNEILAYVQKLNELNTDDIEPTCFIQNKEGAMREDMIHPSLDMQSVMRNAPSQKQGFFSVPKVIDTDEEET